MDVADELLNNQAKFQAHLEDLYQQSQHEFAKRFLKQVHRDLAEVNQPTMPTIYKRLLYHSRHWCSKTLLAVAQALDPDQTPPLPGREDMVDVTWYAGRFDADACEWFARFADRSSRHAGHP